MKIIEHKFILSKHKETRRYEYIKICGNPGGYNAILVLPFTSTSNPLKMSRRITSWKIIDNLFKYLEGKEIIYLVIHKNDCGRCSVNDIFEYLRIYTYDKHGFISYFLSPMDPSAGRSKEDIDKLVDTLFSLPNFHILHTKVRETALSVYSLNLVPGKSMADNYLGRTAWSMTTGLRDWWSEVFKQELYELLQ